MKPRDLIRNRIRSSQHGYHSSHLVSQEEFARMSFDLEKLVRGRLASLLARSMETKMFVEKREVSLIQASGFEFRADLWAFTERELQAFVEQCISDLGIEIDKIEKSP